MFCEKEMSNTNPCAEVSLKKKRFEESHPGWKILAEEIDSIECGSGDAKKRILIVSVSVVDEKGKTIVRSPASFTGPASAPLSFSEVIERGVDSALSALDSLESEKRNLHIFRTKNTKPKNAASSAPGETSEFGSECGKSRRHAISLKLSKYRDLLGGAAVMSFASFFGLSVIFDMFRHR